MLARTASHPTLRSTPGAAPRAFRRPAWTVALALLAAHAPSAAAPAGGLAPGLAPQASVAAAPSSPAGTLPPAHSSDMGATADTSTAAAKWRSPRDSSLVTVLIVRHAEKNTAMLGHDVPLTEAGAARARELRRIAGDTGVDAIYATPTQRAMQTAQPLATALGESLTVVYDTDETVRRLKTRHWGQVVVVVGHSDTVPQIVEGLTGKAVPAFREEFDLLYVVTLARDGRSTILRLRYGERS